MRKVRDLLWTWLLPDGPYSMNEKAWLRSGGKWIIFDRKDNIIKLAHRLEPYIDAGQIASAKYWNEDPSAICVYCLDYDKERTLKILQKLDAGPNRVWEYDYAWDKNIKRPLDFMYSWFSKFRTILQGYGVIGSLRLLADILRSEKKR